MTVLLLVSVLAVSFSYTPGSSEFCLLTSNEVLSQSHYDGVSNHSSLLNGFENINL
ncbi:MAG: hypothetical protein WCS80_00985 [Bacilli bacterium]